jgi:hypothetical protein
MPKHIDDRDARAAAEEFIGEANEQLGNTQNAAPIANSFPAVEFETASKTVEGESVYLRRIVMVGPWEVVTVVE